MNNLYYLSEDQQAIRTLAREIARERIAPLAAQVDETGEYPQEQLKILGAQGLMGLHIPEEYGGAAAGSLDLGVTVLVFTIPVIVVQVPAAMGWAALTGAVAGGLAGLVGSLAADVRAHRRGDPAARDDRPAVRGNDPGAPGGQVPSPVAVHGESASERG